MIVSKTSYTVVKPDSVVLKMATTVVDKFNKELGHIDLADVQFSWRRSMKCKYHGMTGLVRGVNRMFTDKKLVVILWRRSWKEHDKAWRHLLIYHELRHIVKRENGEYALRRHDVEDFYDMIKEYGPRWENASKFLAKLDK
jgi:hypothetical protein